MTVGEKLRKQRRRMKKRQRDIAKAVGVTQPTVHAWESDKWSPRVEQIRDVAKAYGLEPADLLPRSS